MWTLAVLRLALAVATTRLTEPPKIEQHVCANGLEVLVVERHAVPLVTVEIALRAGSVIEPPELNGLSHLWEHMFFKANRALPSQEAWLQRARELGIQWNGRTETERVNYFVTTTSDHARDAVRFLRDAIVTPALDAQELERERPVVAAELDRNEANPRYHLWHEMEQRLWATYPSRKDPLGSRATILAATPVQMELIRSRYAVPNNAVLVVTGDVRAAEVFAQADADFAAWARAADPFVAYPRVEHPPLTRAEVVLVEQPVQVVTGSFGWHGMSIAGPEVELTYAADLLSAAIEAPSSRFQKALVESGACLRADLNYFSQVSTGPISLDFEATAAKVDACLQAILAELPKLRAVDYLSEAERRTAARTIEIGQVAPREKNLELAHELSFWWILAGLEYYLGYVDHVYAVQPEAIARYLDRYVLGRPYVFGVMVSPAMKAQGLDAAHFEKLLGIEGGRR
jgi:zinc protease